MRAPLHHRLGWTSSLLRLAGPLTLLALAACRAVAPTLPILESAGVDAPTVNRSCVGTRYCREDVVDAKDRATLAELDEACARHGGTSSSTRCVRDGAIASCTANGSGLGAITVLAYAPPGESEVDLTKAAEQCDEFEGTFERFSSL